MNPVRLRGDRMNPVRTIERIIKAPDIHWVGNGFRVRQYFPDGDESPMLDRMSPFLLLDYNEPYYFEASPFDTGVTPHPHKGFETVTFSFSGSIEHKDAAGNSGVIHSGDVQWMLQLVVFCTKNFMKRICKAGTFVPCFTIMGKST